jgi:NAD(P)H-flavin reductase
MAQFELIMPKMGESIAEATITKWLKNEGDTIKLDEPVVEIATDKVDSEVPSTNEGILVKKLWNEGDVVPVGAAIAVISSDASQSVAPVAQAPKEVVQEAVKQVEQGVFSTFANTELQIGNELQVMTPMGNFLLNPQSSAKKSYVLFAAGSGITPILSIAKTVLKEEPESDVTLFYGNKGFSSIIFREELEALKSLHLANFRIIHVLSRESLGNKIQKGRIDAEKCAQLYDAFLKDQSIDAVYTCGPESMILDVEKTLIEKGVKEDDIVVGEITKDTE